MTYDVRQLLESNDSLLSWEDIEEVLRFISGDDEGRTFLRGEAEVELLFSLADVIHKHCKNPDQAINQVLDRVHSGYDRS